MNILFLCSYPIQTPRHGGQLRAHHLVGKYKKLGHNVEVAGVLGSEGYIPENGFCVMPPRVLINSLVSNPLYMEDYAIGKIYATLDDYYHQLRAEIKTIPDLIHVEQPWLFEFAIRYQKEYAPLASLIYGSQNIEHTLKKEMLAEKSTLENVITGETLTLATELNAIINADAVIAVTKSDIDWINQYTNAPIYLASNGVAKWQGDQNPSDEIKTLISNRKYAIYCASAHPPNVSGFLEMLLNSEINAVNLGINIIIAGSVGYQIHDYFIEQFQSVPNNFIITGEVTQPDLEFLLNGAHTILLPITKGGGSNLKTAEAIWSSKHVVATTHAFRGFEEHTTLNGINIIDSPLAFANQIQLTLDLPPLNLNKAELLERDAVTWDKTLASLEKVVAIKSFSPHKQDANRDRARRLTATFITETKLHIINKFKEANEYREQLSLIESALLNAESKAQHFESKAIDAESRVQHFESKAIDAESRVQHFESKAIDAESRAISLENQLNLTINSVSWKLTKPLRIIKSKL